MERNESVKTLSSLADYQGDSDEEDDEAAANDNISESDEEKSQDVPISMITRLSPAPAVAPVNPKKASRLVSYGADEIEEDEDEKDVLGDLNTSGDAMVVDYGESLNSELASSLSRSVRNKSVDEIEIPPEPPGRCSKHLQEKINGFYEKKMRGFDLNAAIQKRKDFRNPSIYEKLIEFCGIDEKGTNYPPDVYNPHMWGSNSYYDELARIQKVEMDKREEDKKKRTKVEFTSGVKKSTTVGDSALDDKKRKSKWDTQPQSVTAAPPVVALAASGTKTVIPAIGNMKKK